MQSEDNIYAEPLLVQLTCEQITRYWDDLKLVAQESTPPSEEFTEAGANVLLTNLMNGSAEAWAMFRGGNIEGLALTAVIQELGMATLNLTIIGVLAFDFIKPDMWEAGLKTLREFAKVRGCKNVVGYTVAPRIVTVAKSLNAELWTYVKFPLEV